MIASTFLCSIVIGFVCTKVVEPRFGKYEGNTDEKIEKLTSEESKGLRAAAITAIVYIILLVIGFFTGPLAAENGAFVGSPLLKGLIPILFVFFSVCAIAYGFASGKFKKSGDISKAMNKQMARAYSTGQSLVHSLRSAVLILFSPQALPESHYLSVLSLL